MCTNYVITKDKLNDEIFRFICTAAMRDAVIQLAYKGKKKPLMASEVLDSIKDKIEFLIDNVLNDTYTSQENYDRDFLDTTINISEFINKKVGNEEFTFGNAQKLLNIILKYLYIISYKNDGLQKNFRFCHCPMDQRLLEDVWKKRAESCIKEDQIDLRNRNYFLKSWGNENFEGDGNPGNAFPERYMLFQKAVRCLASKEGRNPLEYDYHIWDSAT